MANDTEEKKIVISLDSASANNALKAIQSLDKASANLNTSLKSAGKGNSEYATELKTLVQSDNQAADSLAELDSLLNEQVGTVNKASDSWKEYRASIAGAKEEGTGLARGLGRSLGGLGSAANAVGLGGVGQGIHLAQAGTDIAEFAPQLKVQLEALAASGTGVTATIAELAAGALPAAGAGFGAMALALAPVVIVVGAVAAAVGFLSSKLDEAQKAAVLLAEQERDATQAKNDAVIANGATTADLVNQIADLGRQADAAQQDIVDAQTAYDAYVASRSNPLQAFGDAVGLFGDQENTLATSITDAQNRFQGLVINMSTLNDAVNNGETAANDLAAQEQALAEGRDQDAKDAIAAQEQALAQAGQTRDRIAALQAQQASLFENRAIAESQAAQSDKLATKFAQEDNKAQLVDHYAKLADISKSGNEKLQSISAEIADLPIQQAADAQKIQEKGNADLSKLNADYFANQIKAYGDFSSQSERIATDTAKTAKRLADDIRDKLSDAARDNDVVAFLQIQRDGQKELKRNAEDAGESEKRRAEDFSRQQEEQRSAFQQRQSEILASIADEKAKSLAAYAEKKAALEQQRQTEQTNIQQAIANENSRYAQQEAREAQQADRQAQRDALQQSFQDAAFARTLAGIQSKTDAELAGLARVQQAAASLSVSAKPTYNSPNIGDYGSFGGSSYKSPYDKIPTASQPIININTSVGDIATHSQVSTAINQGINAAASAWVKGIAGAQGH